MAKVTCTRPNASECINGIPFVKQEDGSVVATGVSPEAAAAFVDFEGYTVEAEEEKQEVVKETAHKGKHPKTEPVA